MRILKIASLTLKYSASVALTLGLIACGGDKGTAVDNFNGNNGGGNGSGNDIAQIGYGAGADFVPGEIFLSTGGNTLSAGGISTLTVSVQVDGRLTTDSLAVTFNSPCFAANEAIIEPISTGGDVGSSNIVFTNNGQVSVRYTANGCVGEDTVTATTNYGGELVTAYSTLTIASDNVQSLSFISATPNYISLKGSGATETSQIRFQVLGSTGAPVKDVNVNFSLDTTVGGLALVNSSDFSGSDGYVTTTVQSGTVSTVVRITAVADLPTPIATQSSGLVVSTGLADQNSMTIASTKLTPVAWGYAGVPAQLSVFLADAFNNPVPDDTAVNFTTNGGSIESGCLTIDGRCSVEWSSQDPRPQLGVDYGTSFNQNFPFNLECPEGIVECRNGRFKVLATAIGNESFVDTNGNGSYDAGTDRFNSSDANNASMCLRNQPTSGSESNLIGCDDLGEAYLDRNLDRTYNVGDEEFIDFGGETAARDSGNGIYDGVLCNDSDEAAGNCTKNTVSVRADITLVMACEVPWLAASEVTQVASGTDRIAFLLADCNGNGLPAGTEIVFPELVDVENLITYEEEELTIGTSQEPIVLSYAYPYPFSILVSVPPPLFTIENAPLPPKDTWSTFSVFISE